MKKQSCKAGQFYCAKYKGKNGDVIVAVVKSVRKCGDVILTDLLTGVRRTKAIGILLQRNKRITKEQAYVLQVVYSQTGDLQKVREKAVKMEAFTNGDSHQELPKDAGIRILQQERFLPKTRKKTKINLQMKQQRLRVTQLMGEITEHLEEVRSKIFHVYEALK